MLRCHVGADYSQDIVNRVQRDTLAASRLVIDWVPALEVPVDIQLIQEEVVSVEGRGGLDLARVKVCRGKDRACAALAVFGRPLASELAVTVHNQLHATLTAIGISFDITKITTTAIALSSIIFGSYIVNSRDIPTFRRSLTAHLRQRLQHFQQRE